MESLTIIVHVLAAIGITGLVLIQQGKGADMGASFGSGASQTIFGSVGTGNALTKATTWLTVIFFVTSLALALFARQQVSGGIQQESLLLNPDLIPVIQQDVPVVPAGGQSDANDVPLAPAIEANVQEVLETDAPIVDDAAAADEDAATDVPAED